MAAILYAIPLTAVAAASAFGWMLAYLGGAGIIMGWVGALATTDARAILFFVAVLFLIVGDFLDGLPAIIILMPVILSLEKLGHINSVHMDVVAIVTLAFGLITPPCDIILLLSSTLAGVSLARALRQLAAIYIVFLVVITVIILIPRIPCCSCRAISCHGRWGASQGRMGEGGFVRNAPYPSPRRLRILAKAILGPVLN